jgi:hypothetical protein
VATSWIGRRVRGDKNMKRAVSQVLLLLLWPGSAVSQEKKEQAQKPLTNESIVWLVSAGLSEDTIISMVNTQPGKYSLGAGDVVALKKARVSEKVITAILNKPTSGRDSSGHTKASSDAAPVIPDQVGLYAFSEGTMQRIDRDFVRAQRQSALRWAVRAIIDSPATHSVAVARYSRPFHRNTVS